MVLKKSNTLYHDTGNTLRRNYNRFLYRKVFTKGARITNLKYYSEPPDFDAVLECIDDRICASPGDDESDLQSLVRVRELLSFFIDLNEDINEGCFARDYIPVMSYNLLDKLWDYMEELGKYQADIHSGQLNLGLGPHNGISITVNLSENGELLKSGHRVFKFDTNRPYEQVRKDYIKQQKRKWADIEHLKRTSNKCGVQRKYELDAKKSMSLEPEYDDDFVYPASEEIAITVVMATAWPDTLKGLSWSRLAKADRGNKLELQKNTEKGKGKTRNWSYHKNISREEIDEAVETFYGINRRILTRTKLQKKVGERKFRRYKRRHPEQVLLNLPELRYPVGLWPDDIARIQAKHQKLATKLQQDYLATRQHKKLNKKRKKPEQRGRDEVKGPGQTFLTHVSFVDDYEYVDKKTREKLNEEANLKKAKEASERIVRTLEPWEFVDEILHHSEPEMKVVFKPCETAADLGNLTLSPPPPSLKPSLKERPSSAASSDAGDFQLLELPLVAEEQENEVSEISSQAYRHEETVSGNNVKDVCLGRKKSNKTNGRTRRKLKQRQEAMRSARTVSFTQEISKVGEDIQKVRGQIVEENKQREEEKDQGQPEKKVKVLSRQVSIITKDNTSEFVESLSDYSYTGIELKLRSSGLRPSYLVRKFGTDYQEASTFPRLLSIDVSQRVMDVVKLFRKTEEPFSKPVASLVFKPNHGSGEEITTDDNLKCTVVTLFIKADMEVSSFEDLYLRMKDKLKYDLIYPITKVVDDFVQIFKLLPYSSYSPPCIVPSPLPRADERTRSQLDWLYALCHWKFDVYHAHDAYALFQQTFQVASVPRPSTSGLCRVIERTPRLGLRSCDLPACYNSPVLQLLACQHALCSRCFQARVIRDLSDKRVPLTCWVPGCHTLIDPVCLQFMLSLPLYKLQQVYLEDLRIQSHPLWQWCPKPGCGRVVKLSGSGFLDNGVVILCDCGTTWCFHCRREGHWPASCEQAKTYFDLREHDYKDLKESKNLISGSCPISRVLCARCAKPDFQRSLDPLPGLNTHNSKPPPVGHGGEDSGLDSGFGSEDGSVVCTLCECVYEVCSRCVQTADSALSVPQVLLQGEEGLSPASSQPVLLPLLYYRSALLHHQEKQLWSWASVEIRTGKILQQLKKSKTRIASSSPTSVRSLFTDGRTTTTSKSITPFSHHGGGAYREGGGAYRDSPQSRTSVVTGVPPTYILSENTLVHLPKKTSVSSRPRTSHVNLSPTSETEKFFLVLVQQFIQQGHVLLEYVYVYLMDPLSVQKTPEIVSLVISLEAIIKQIQQLLSSMKFSSSSILVKLHKLHDAGNKLVVAITTTFKNTNVNSLASRSPTFCQSGYNKLPPIGHKYTKVKFTEPSPLHRNTTTLI